MLLQIPWRSSQLGIIVSAGTEVGMVSHGTRGNPLEGLLSLPFLRCASREIPPRYSVWGTIAPHTVLSSAPRHPQVFPLDNSSIYNIATTATIVNESGGAGGGLSLGAVGGIIGGVLGVIILLCVAAIVYLIKRNKRIKVERTDSIQEVAAPEGGSKGVAQTVTPSGRLSYPEVY